MLIRFNTSNFLSFNEETEFNMLASNSLKMHKDHVYTLKKNLNVLKASAIYGANGAGKSNLIKAIHSFKEIVEDGCIPKKVDFRKNKLVEDSIDKPITHEIEFSINNNIYTYGIAFSSNVCIEEWLYETGIKNPKLIFERKYSPEKKHPIIKMNEKFLRIEKNKLLISLMEENLLMNNELFISKRENLKIKEIDELCDWFTYGLNIIYPETKSTSIFSDKYSNEEFKSFSEQLLDSFDLGIDKLFLKSEDFETFLKNEGLDLKDDIDDIKKEIEQDNICVIEGKYFTISITKDDDKYVVKRVVTSRTVNNKEVVFELKEESDGTQRLFDFIPLIDNLLKYDCTYIVDEFDRSLHPFLLQKLVKKIMSSNTKGQLVFTTHEAGLLDCKIFRADEIWFAEKDKELQNTHLYTLAEFKPRYDLDIEKGYLNGRFGAIPFLSKLEDLNWNNYGI